MQTSLARIENLGEISEQSLKNEALGVARETMKRVKYNFHVIANNLINSKIDQ